MEEAVIVAAARTPVGRFKGALSSQAAHTLGSIAIQGALRRAKVQGHEVNEVIIGQVLTAGQGQNPARQASVGAGIPFSVPATTVNMVCGSGLRAVVMAAQAVRTGDAQVVVAGGQESMSRAPHCVDMRSGIEFGNIEMVDTMRVDGLMDAFVNCHMSVTAENIAQQWNVSRQCQDEFAAESLQKCKVAQSAAFFEDEIVPVPVQSNTGITEVQEDELPTFGSTIEELQTLCPEFIKDGSGTVTAGNVSGMSDGAAAVVVMSATEARERGLQPIVRIVSWAQAGVHPSTMGTGTSPAVCSALKKAGWKMADVDLFELNEASAAQSLVVIKDLDCDPSKVNINGGALGLGHPIGASGTRILVTVLYALKSLGLNKAVAALCVGGGMGIALCVQRC